MEFGGPVFKNLMHCSYSRPLSSRAIINASISMSPPRAIKLVVSDVDGTLLDSKQLLTARTEEAISTTEKHGVRFLLATGKARGPWFHAIKDRLGPPNHGVFLQGLAIIITLELDFRDLLNYSL